MWLSKYMSTSNKVVKIIYKEKKKKKEEEAILYQKYTNTWNKDNAMLSH